MMMFALLVVSNLEIAIVSLRQWRLSCALCKSMIPQTHYHKTFQRVCDVVSVLHILERAILTPFLPVPGCLLLVFLCQTFALPPLAIGIAIT